MNKKIESLILPVDRVELNTGQIEGVPANPRKISDAKLEALKNSIKDLPDMLSMRELLVYPIGDKYVVLGGNMRYRACCELGYTDVPCKVIPEDTPAEKLRAIVMQDNNPYGDTDWDIIFADWDLDELKDWGVDLPEFEDKALAESNTAEDDDFDENEEDIEPRCKTGDIWQLGEHRLMCGDSTEAECVKMLMGGVMADMVFTDPPYGVAIGDKNKMLSDFQGKGGRCTDNIANDAILVDDLYPILVAAMTNCRENCKDDASYFVTSPQGGELGLMMMMMKDAGLPVRHILIWEKNCATFSLGRLDYDYQHEPIFYTWTKKHKNYRKGEFRTTIWKYDKPRKCDLHPTMKPVELVANCMLDCTIEGDVVLDVFGGSGTTIIAAEKLNRKAYLMELSEHYCDVIIARWEKLTGKEAVKLN